MLRTGSCKFFLIMIGTIVLGLFFWHVYTLIGEVHHGTDSSLIEKKIMVLFINLFCVAALLTWFIDLMAERGTPIDYYHLKSNKQYYIVDIILTQGTDNKSHRIAIIKLSKDVDESNKSTEFRVVDLESFPELTGVGSLERGVHFIKMDIDEGIVVQAS